MRAFTVTLRLFHKPCVYEFERCQVFKLENILLPLKGTLLKYIFLSTTFGKLSSYSFHLEQDFARRPSAYKFFQRAMLNNFAPIWRKVSCRLQVKRRSHSGSSLLNNTSTPRMTSQLSMSSINLTSSQQPQQADNNALLAQLLQPVQQQAQHTYYNKPILPAPAPQTQILTPATVLVAPLALTMPTIKPAHDLSRNSQQVSRDII